MKAAIKTVTQHLVVFTIGMSLFGSSASAKLNGIEVDLVQPFIPEVGIVTVKSTFSLGDRQEFILGAFIRPNVKHDVVDRINEYLLIVGYRHYLTKNFHLEASLDAGWAKGINLFDQKEYSNPTLLGELNAGYRFQLGSNDQGIYLLPQFGVIHGIVTDIGPRNGKTDTFIQGKLLLGIRF